jgi:glycosyltransferase involved in cell wall biosynthesis
VREIHNGIPLDGTCADGPEILSEWRRKLSVPAEAGVIVTLLRFSPEKNTELLFQIIKDVVARAPLAFFVVAGEGPLLTEFKEKIRAAGLEKNVRLPGFVADTRGLLAAGDIFLLPSKLELHSVAVLEAMSGAVPVVISENVGCNGEFIDHWRNGVLLDPFKEDGWADALVRLLRDPPLRRQIGEAGFKTCRERFDIRGTAKKFEDLYAELARH